MSTTITDKAGLQAMKDTLDGDFVLGNAIDASGGDFTPVGDNSTPFTGTFDGGDYAITGLTIDHTGNYAGLFGYTNGATISNVTLSSPSVTASGDVVGALVGEADDTTISYITVTGATIEVADDYAGGLVGIAEGTGIAKCSFSGAVIGGDSCIGGLIGWLSGTAAISKCYVATSSTVNGGNYVGGFIGYNSGTGVTDCYTMADVVATNYYAGGFVGYQDANGIIVNSYSTGQPTAADTPGGFCADNSNTITNCFWDTETSGTEASDGGTGRTTAQMLFITTYTDWDFCFIWNINVALNDGYPFLRWTGIDGGDETREETIGPVYDPKGRVPKGARVEARSADTGAVVETQYLDSSGKATFTELPNDVDVTFWTTWGGTTQNTQTIQSAIVPVTRGGTGASDEYNARSNLGLGSEDSPQFTGIELGHATDTTIARAAAGRATIESVAIVRGPASATDNIIPRFNLTTGDLIQQTGITADDSDNVSGMGTLGCGAITVGSDGAGADILAHGGTASNSLTWDASENVLDIASTMKAADNLIDLAIADAATLSSGRGRGLHIGYTVSGTKTGTYGIRPLNIEMTIAENVASACGFNSYIAAISNKTVGNLFGGSIYLSDQGNAVSNLIGLDIGINSTNVAASRHTGLRIRNHSGTATSAILIEEAFTDTILRHSPSGVDLKLITLDNSSGAIFYWDDSEDKFRFNKGLHAGGAVVVRPCACVIAANDSYITTQADATCDGTDD